MLLMPPGQADVVLFISGFSLVALRYFFVALPSSTQKLVAGPVQHALGLEAYPKLV